MKSKEREHAHKRTRLNYMPPIEQSKTCTDWEKTPNWTSGIPHNCSPITFKRERPWSICVELKYMTLCTFCKLLKNFRHGNKTIVFTEKNYRQSAPRLLRFSLLDHTDIYIIPALRICWVLSRNWNEKGNTWLCPWIYSGATLRAFINRALRQLVQELTWNNC